jgi:hypothetical protein
MRLVGAQIILLLALTGCGKGETTIDERPCPQGGTSLTYDDFGRDFLSKYCQVCHGQGGTDRNGAPSDYDFYDVEMVRAFKDRIFARAAGDNTSMPPGPDDPPAADREKLAEWLACGAP